MCLNLFKSTPIVIAMSSPNSARSRFLCCVKNKIVQINIIGAIFVIFSHFAPASDPNNQKFSSRAASRFDDIKIIKDDSVFITVESAMPDNKSFEVDDLEPMFERITTKIAIANAPKNAHTPIEFEPKIVLMPSVMPSVAPKVAPELMPST